MSLIIFHCVIIRIHLKLLVPARGETRHFPVFSGSPKLQRSHTIVQYLGKLHHIYYYLFVDDIIIFFFALIQIQAFTAKILQKSIAQWLQKYAPHNSFKLNPFHSTLRLCNNFVGLIIIFISL